MNILLVCGAGASTSLLVMKMQAAAKKDGKPYIIRAIAQTALKYEMKDADVILLGPQITFMLEQITEMAAPLQIPVRIIRSQDYGMCDGEKVLQFAEQLVSKSV